jgi:hypothetical protein
MSWATARRFVVTSTMITTLVCALVAGFAVAGPLLFVARGPEPGQIAGYLGALGLIVGLVAFRASRFTSTLRMLRMMYPKGAVFLARRHPSVVSDLETFMSEKAFVAELSDGCVPALVDHAEIPRWSTGREPRELLLMAWEKLGGVILEQSLTAVLRSMSRAGGSLMSEARHAENHYM